MILILDRIILNMYLITSYIQHIMPIPTRPSSYNEYNNRIVQNVHKISINIITDWICIKFNNHREIWK